MPKNERVFTYMGTSDMASVSLDGMPVGAKGKVSVEWEDPPKDDWTPNDVADWAFNATKGNNYDARRLAARKTADLVTEAIVRWLEHNERIHKDAWAGAYQCAIRYVKSRKNNDLRRLD